MFYHSLMNTKSEIRQAVKQQLRMMTPEQRSSESALILQKVASDVHFVQAEVVLLYFSLPAEVQTQCILESWSRKKTILLPVVKGDDLELRKFISLQQMEQSGFGIQVPTGKPFMDWNQVDFIVVPGLAFTLNGIRLGRGRGFYDRFLAHEELQQAYKVGICYACQLFENLPSEPHDVRMDRVIAAQ